MGFLGKYKEIILEFGLSFLLLFGGLIAAYFSLRHIKTPIILHFSSYTGINQIGEPKDLLWVGGLAGLVWFINLNLAASLELRSPSLSRVTGLATLFFSALLFIGFMAIISVNS